MDHKQHARMWELKEGDRFIFFKDKKRNRWTMVAKPIGQRTESTFNRWAVMDGTKTPERFSGMDVAVFLRSAQESV